MSSLFSPLFRFDTLRASINHERIFLLIFLCASFAHKSRRPPHNAMFKMREKELFRGRMEKCKSEQLHIIVSLNSRDGEMKNNRILFYDFHTQFDVWVRKEICSNGRKKIAGKVDCGTRNKS